jgi:hypothetical protein
VDSRGVQQVDVVAKAKVDGVAKEIAVAAWHFIEGVLVVGRMSDLRHFS